MTSFVAASRFVARIEGFATRPLALATMSIWAAAEAIVLPVVPDVGLCLVALFAPRRAAILFAAVVGGALAGTLVLGALACRTPDGVDAMFVALPGIDESTLSEASGSLGREGLVGFARIGAGMPLKVYSTAWVELGGDAGGLIAGALLNRITRVGPPVAVAALIGWMVGPGLRRRLAVVLALYAAFWIALYAYLWLG